LDVLAIILVIVFAMQTIENDKPIPDVTNTVCKPYTTSNGTYVTYDLSKNICVNTITHTERLKSPFQVFQQSIVDMTYGQFIPDSDGILGFIRNNPFTIFGAFCYSGYNRIWYLVG
jgi:hypothetical protein